VKHALPEHCLSRYLVRVRFGETDLMGIVHHGTYISYFEVGRVEYMRRRGLDYHSWTELGIHLPVVEAYVRYRKTARFDGFLRRKTPERVRPGAGALRLPSAERRGNEAPETNGDAEVVAEGHTLLACVDRNHVPRRIPAEAEAVLLGPELDRAPHPGNGHRPRPVAPPAEAADPGVVVPLAVPLASVKP
jgi:acyl-CoA thioester hydrolase